MPTRLGVLGIGHDCQHGLGRGPERDVALWKYLIAGAARE
jgi:hypothetical protein